MIYVVEDDPGIRELECYALRQAGFEARGFEEGQSFLEAVRVQLPQLVLLDVMLPGEDGNRLLARLKQDSRTRGLPVIMVTARGEGMDKVQGLDGGADDYVVKLFGVMELLSRVRAVLRRSKEEQPQDELAVGHLRMDVARHRVFVDGRDVTLTHMEFELLRYLLRVRDRLRGLRHHLLGLCGDCIGVRDKRAYPRYQNKRRHRCHRNDANGAARHNLQ